jgi:two-component system cell cycle sensor histidine kinase/response regulator CckA
MKEEPRVLIVEDDPHYREFLTGTLERQYVLDLARDGQEAVSWLDRGRYDAILCDLRVPGLSGKELVQTIRSRTDEETLLVVITGFEEDWSPVEATEAQVYFYLKKGQFSPQELRKVLKNGMDLRRERLAKRRTAEQLERLNQELEDTIAARTRALQESEANYRNLFQQSLVGIYIQLEGRVVLANDRLCEMLGRSPDELAGKEIETLLIPVSRHDRLALPCQGNDAWLPAEEVRLKTHGGRERAALHCAGPIQMQGTKAVQGCVVDITEWRELEQHFVHHQKMESLGTLVSGIAHEFNNILAAMMPQTELLTRRAGETPALQRSAQIILAMAEKASRLTRQLLHLSRKPRMEKRSIDVNGWLREASSFLATSLGSRERIQLDLDPRAGHIEGDPHQLDQILLNLVLNARDAMAEGGPIRITSAFRLQSSREKVPAGNLGRSFVEITVEDAGCGIPPEHLPKIFDPFFTTKETGKGTGLGLSVAYNLVKQHGGEIYVKSRVGKGSSVHIFLPHAPGRHPEMETEPPCGRILVADTNPKVLDLFRDILSDLRYEIIPVENQQDAVEIYARQKDTIDCVILNGRFESSTEGSSVGRILDLNPRIKVILTHSEPAAPLGKWFDSAKRKGASIQQISLPAAPEALSVSLEKVLYGGSA